jgi:hypothetical protein
MPNAFVDPEDSQLVADAKNVFNEPVPYTYTEVTDAFGRRPCSEVFDF